VNIGIDIKVLAKTNAGIARTVSALLEQLQRVDQSNHYFLFERTPSGFQPVNPRWKTVLIRSRLPGTLWTVLRLPRVLARLKIDLFWEPENVLPGFFFPSRCRRVVTVHDLTFMHYPETMQPRTYWMTRFFTDRTLKTSHRLVAVSDYTRQDIGRLFGPAAAAKTAVVPNGRPDWQLPADYASVNRGDHLLFVGSLEPRKNLKNLLTALAILRKQGQTVNLRIVGPAGWKNSDLTEFVEANGLGEQITRLGYLSEEGLRQEYLHCKALVFVSIFEGFGLPVLEALQTDTLVLTSRATVMEEIGGPAVMLCDPLDPIDIASKISLLYRPGFNREVYLHHRQEVLEKYSWEDSARAMLDIFRVVSYES
jgi:glycosyltransferase involved in cell wall biosynthesis